MSWQDDLTKIDDIFHQKLRTDATFEWLYSKVIEDAAQSEGPCDELIDGLTQLGRHVTMHAQYNIAQPIFEKTLDLAEKKTGFNSLRSGKLYESIAYCLMMQGRFNEALAAIERWIKSDAPQSHKDSPDYRELMVRYSEYLYRAGCHTNAHELLTELIKETPPADPIYAEMQDKLTRYEKPCPNSLDPADLGKTITHMGDEMLHGSPKAIVSLRQAVMELVVKQALAGAPWKDLCKGPMEINGITIEDVEAEIERRKATATS